MHKHITGTLDRADELYKDVMAEYDQSLHQRIVSDRAIQLTHEVCERLRSVLDRTARRYWEKHVAPSLSEEDRKAASVYFPVTSNHHGFNSVLGRWKWKTVRDQHQAVYDYLLGLQPFSSAENKWLAILNDLAVQGKHIDLVPQTRTEEQRVTVRGAGGGSVSWGPGVTFGSGVSVMGAPINPATQRIMPTPGVTEEIVTWVSFIIRKHGVNAAEFCKDACANVRKIATELSDKFDLS